MRILAVTLVFVTALAAQRNGGMGGFRGSPGRGGGSGYRPGGSVGIGGYNTGAYNRGGYYRGGYSYGYNAGYIGGYRPGFPGGGFRYPHYGYAYGRRSYYPFIGFGYGYYPYGGWYGNALWSAPSGYYAPYYDYAYPNGPSGSSVTVVTAPAADSSPGTVVINNSGWQRFQNRGRVEDGQNSHQPAPAVQSEQPNRESRATRSPIYLIALNTGVIWMAVAYWPEGDSLHFVSTKGENKQIPTRQLDRALTEQLNQERNIPFRLP